MLGFSRRFACVILLSAGVVSVAQAHSPAIENGDFERPEIPSNSGRQFAVGDTWLTSWSVRRSGGFVTLVNGFPGPAAIGPFTGDQYLRFNGGDEPPGVAVMQSFDTQVGGQYLVKFAIGRLGDGAGQMQLTVWLFADDRTVLHEESFSRSEKGWEEHAFRFVATTPTTTISFDDTSSATVAVDVTLDSVRIVCVPGPKDIDEDLVAALAYVLERIFRIPPPTSTEIARHIVWILTPFPPSPCD